MQITRIIHPVIIMAFLVCSACQSPAQPVNLSVADFEKGMAAGKVQVLDVRTPGEFQSGHLKNAFLADWNNRAEFRKRTEALDKSQPVYVYCLGGSRSSDAAEWLGEKGFTAYNLSGGIAAWRNAGKPLEDVVQSRQISIQEYMAGIPADKTVLVDFGATWCPPCKFMIPVLDSLVKTDGSKFVLVKIDGGQQTAICQELKVDAFPTFIIYKQGKEFWRKQGITAAKEFLAQF